ncbi:lipoprotein N-acyltransferase Lnb domain-containing protein [Dyadobacter arcticus]|uniref:CRISPR/Cas system CMR-associated protein Cmr5 small subunit/uncharacterized membrane protein n=1 Tax=Dyadobacter arcticus TaxID=1078754 RepID=A0ABX0ULI1_9BACT|nr:DUF4105 domain-containing protein [Dyadobacter arcticus]NIJ51966.1 CRISPR/Cas system CMR-associated protein Cmr5 small subunit/uncharacterized membrane protein [Dyadobacter arcticus]
MRTRILNNMNPNNRKFFKYLVISILLISQSFSAFAQFATLSPQTKVSLVTFGPGEELYSGFGHSALWIYDPVLGLDAAYSYGTFSFESGNFYIKFLRGTLPYTISVAPMGPQVAFYRSENRSVSEQVLNLSQAQKQKLYNYLETNYLPQNRKYQYQYFYDNCATRLVNALKAATADSLVYTGYTKEKLSFRQWIDRYAYKQNPWADFGMDLAIGAQSDEIATAEQATFLPDNLATAFGNAKLKTSSGVQPLVMGTNDFFTAEPIKYKGTFTPMVTFWTMAVLVLAFTDWQTRKGMVNFALDKILFSIVGLAGWILVTLWVIRNDDTTSWNYDLLWAFPLWLPLIFFISKHRKPYWFQFLLILYGFLLLCATGNVLKHNYVVIPILLTLIVRVYYINNSLSKIPQRAK